MALSALVICALFTLTADMMLMACAALAALSTLTADMMLTCATEFACDSTDTAWLIALSALVICALFAVIADRAPATEAASDVCCADNATTAADMALSALVICALFVTTAADTTLMLLAAAALIALASVDVTLAVPPAAISVRTWPVALMTFQPWPSIYCTCSPNARVYSISSTIVVPSVCRTVTRTLDAAVVLRMFNVCTLRCVLAAGEDTTVVVAAEAIAVLVRPGVMVPDALSTHDACTSTGVAASVTI
jgi:hypothetical protein